MENLNSEGTNYSDELMKIPKESMAGDFKHGSSHDVSFGLVASFFISEEHNQHFQRIKKQISTAKGRKHNGRIQ